MSPEQLKTELKRLLLEAVEKDEPAGGLSDDEVLFGPESRLDMDSLDALQVSMAIQKHYGIRIADSKDTRRALGTIALLAEHIIAQGSEKPA